MESSRLAACSGVSRVRISERGKPGLDGALGEEAPEGADADDPVGAAEHVVAGLPVPPFRLGAELAHVAQHGDLPLASEAVQRVERRTH